MPVPRVIEVFADITCPFTHVGLRRLVAHRASVGADEVSLLVRAWPLEIVNGAPLDPGPVGQKVADLRAQVAPDLFTGFDEAAFPATSLPALAVVAAAYECSREVGERVSLELRDLVFEQGVDVADAAALASVESRHGLVVGPRHAERVLFDHAKGVQRGVVGSPHFFTPDGGFFCPSLDIHHEENGHLRIAFDREGFDEFMASCFA